MGSYWTKEEAPSQVQPLLPYGFEDDIKEINSFVPVDNKQQPVIKTLPCRKCFYRTKRHETVLNKAVEAYENSIVEYKFAIRNHEDAREILISTRKDLKVATDRHHKSLSEVGVKSVLTRRQCRLATEAVKKAKQNVEFLENREKRKEKAVTNLDKLKDRAQMKLDIVRDKEKSCFSANKEVV